MATPQQLQQILQDIENKLKNLPGATGLQQMYQSLQQSYRASQDVNKAFVQAQSLLRAVNNEIADLNDELGVTTSTFRNILDQLTRSRSTVGSVTGAVKSLTGAAQQLLGRQTEYGKMTAKELEKLKIRSYIQFDNLRQEKEALEAEASRRDLSALELRALEAAQDFLDKNVDLEGSFKRQLEDALREQKAIEESLGVTGALLKAMTEIPGLSSISKYFNISEATESMENYSKSLIEAVRDSAEFKSEFTQLQSSIQQHQEKLVQLRKNQAGLDKAHHLYEYRYAASQIAINQREEELNKLLARRGELEAEATEAASGLAGKTKIALKGLQTLVQGFAKAITDPAAVFTFLVKGASTLSKQLVDIQKSLNVSYERAQQIRSEFARQAFFANETFVNTERLLKAQVEYVRVLGFQGRLNTQNAQAFAEVTERLGISAESAARLQFYTEATTRDFAQQKVLSYAVASSVEAQYGVHLDIRGVMEEVGKQSAYTLAQFNGSVTALTRAVAEAKALGLTLDTINTSAGQLVQFESSIRSQLEAQLLIGREINLDQARYYALTNNIEGLTKELVREAGTYSEFIHMNRIAQEAFAKSLGMNVQQVSELLLMEKYRGMTYEEIAAQAGTQVADQVEALNVTQRFQDVLLKVKTTLLDIVEGPIGTMVGALANILGSSTAMGGIFGLMALSALPKLISSLKIVVGLTRTAALASAAEATGVAISATVAALGPFGLLAAAGVAATIYGLINNMLADDMLSTPGYGKRTLVTEEGSFKLNDKDTVIAGTRLFGDNQPNKAPRAVAATAAPQQQNNMMKDMVTSINTLIDVVKSGGDVIMDGQKVGRAQRLGAFKTGVA